jgi:outer membrane protein
MMRLGVTAGMIMLVAGVASSAVRLTLEQAEQRALKNHPGIAVASFNAQAAGTAVKQVRSALHPLVTGNLTTAGADRDTTISAGTLQTSGLATRAATGLGVSQLITDFGRTSYLAESARLRASAQASNVGTTRAQVLLEVQRAYYAVLAADQALAVVQARVKMHDVTLRQVRALAQSNLRSTLDVSFAEVSLLEAELALYQAENAAKASRARLLAAIGDEEDMEVEVADVLMPGQVADEAAKLIAEAMKNRPDIAAVRLNQDAAQRFASAEKRLRYPALSLVGVVGVVPIHQKNISNQYSAAGLNMTIPFLNGGLNGARLAEAEFLARRAGKSVDLLRVRVAADVRVAWFEANNAWRRLDVTARLADQAAKALRLASTRYELGLSSILELSQAQVSQTSAQIAATTAKYDYLTRVADLNYAIGALR